MTTPSTGTELVGSVGGSFFTWLQRDVLPHISTGVNSIILSISICVNIAFLVIYQKRRLYDDPSSFFIVQLASVDLIASVFVLIFSIVASASQGWVMGDVGCSLQSFFVLWCFQLSFGLVITCQVERTVRIYNHDLHMKTFNSVKGIVVVSVVVWVVDLGLAVAPVAGVGRVAYDPDQFLCNFVNTSNEVYFNLQFALTLFLAFFVLVVTSAMMVDYKRRSAILTRQTLQVKAAKPTPYVRFKDEVDATAAKGKHGGLKTSTTAKVMFKTGDPKADGKGQANGDAPKGGKDAKADRDGGAKTPLTGKYDKNKQTKSTGPGPGILSRTPSRHSLRSRSNSILSRHLIFDIFSDDSDEKEFHLAITYVITSVVLQFLWLSYLIASYYDVYAPGAIWRGAYTLGILLANVSYCIKPIIYLAHNKNYRRETIKSVPETVKKKASEVSQSVEKTMDAIHKKVFVSGGGPSSASAALSQTLAVSKTLAAWKKKATGSKTPVSPAKTPVPPAKTPTPAGVELKRDKTLPSVVASRPPAGHSQEVKTPARAAAHTPGRWTSAGRQRSNVQSGHATPDDRRTPLGTSVLSIDVLPSGKSSAMEMASIGGRQKSSTTLGSASGVASRATDMQMVDL